MQGNLMNDTKCPLCKNTGKLSPRTRDGEDWNCPTCGEYFISGTSLAIIKYDDVKPFIPEIIKWIDGQHNNGIKNPEITSDILYTLTEPK
jgi:predicted RNA-binding Zn-ribbon protein involved in translation (DUF1610 family)